MLTLLEYCRLLGLYAATGKDGVVYTFTERPRYINGYYTLGDYSKTAKVISKNVSIPKLHPRVGTASEKGC